ncbi:MAG: ERCC4 domain-containing protein [Candidatus Odinarchaeia archaeon]
MDSGEKDYVFEAFDSLNVKYEKRQLRFLVCDSCKKIYIEGEEPEECCGDTFSKHRVADIVGSKWNFAIERKKGDNLASSLLNNELYDQLERLSGFFGKNVALVFEGRFEDFLTNPYYKDRINQILSIPSVCIQYGISFIQVDNIYMLIRMLKFFDYKCGELPALRLKYEGRDEAIPSFIKILNSVKGISFKTAFKIHENYESIYELVMDLANGTFRKVKGIGEKTINKLRESFL